MEEKILITESELIDLIMKVLSEANVNRSRSYGDYVPDRFSQRTGGYGGDNVMTGARGRMDYYRGDKPEYYAGIPRVSEIEIYPTNKFQFFKAKQFRENMDTVQSSLDLFQDGARGFGTAANDLMRATKGNVKWKVITDDPKAKIDQQGRPTGRHLFWMVLLPGESDYKLFKNNILKRYLDDYNNTTVTQYTR